MPPKRKAQSHATASGVSKKSRTTRARANTKKDANKEENDVREEREVVDEPAVEEQKEASNSAGSSRISNNTTVRRRATTSSAKEKKKPSSRVMQFVQNFEMPDDILFNIMCFLPPLPSYQTMELVCQQWYKFVRQKAWDRCAQVLNFSLVKTSVISVRDVESVFKRAANARKIIFAFIDLTDEVVKAIVRAYGTLNEKDFSENSYYGRPKWWERAETAVSTATATATTATSSSTGGDDEKKEKEETKKPSQLSSLILFGCKYSPLTLKPLIHSIPSLETLSLCASSSFWSARTGIPLHQLRELTNEPHPNLKKLDFRKTHIHPEFGKPWDGWATLIAARGASAGTSSSSSSSHSSSPSPSSGPSWHEYTVDKHPEITVLCDSTHWHSYLDFSDEYFAELVVECMVNPNLNGIEQCYYEEESNIPKYRSRHDRKWGIHMKDVIISDYNPFKFDAAKRLIEGAGLDPNRRLGAKKDTMLHLIIRNQLSRITKWHKHAQKNRYRGMASSTSAASTPAPTTRSTRSTRSQQPEQSHSSSSSSNGDITVETDATRIKEFNIAQMKEVKEQITFLLRHGANTNVKNLEKETPPDIVKRIDTLIADVQSWKEKKATTSAAPKGKATSRGGKKGAKAATAKDDNNNDNDKEEAAAKVGEETKDAASTSPSTATTATSTNAGEEEYYATYPFKLGFFERLLAMGNNTA